MIETSVVKLKYSFPGEEFVCLDEASGLWELNHGRNECPIAVYIYQLNSDNLPVNAIVPDKNTIRMYLYNEEEYEIVIVV